ncbi:MAG TPA: glycosyltransferase family 4 protein [Balneolales bacterium]|nr:glycosyltransferase family 4 protein [Balneolales bacterium]
MSFPKRIAIVHYHLRGGGVTRVIQHAVDALRSRNIETVVVCGEEPQHSKSLNICVNEKLAYNQTIPENEVGALFRELTDSCTKILGGEPDLWHIHNHNLGKNQTLPLLTHYIAKQQHPLLLQIHDFPEDGRPGNYHYLFNSLRNTTSNHTNLAKLLYPVSGHIFYSVLNRRDYNFLSDAGLPESHLHLLPNAIDVPPITDEKPKSKALDGKYKKLILYPTRAIRRKNIGEFLLHAILSEENNLFAVTLAPKNPKAKPRFKRWVDFSETLDLPVVFEAGKKSHWSYTQLLHLSDLIMTTSVAEGFGLAFLEPWLAGNKLYGRNLPDITIDFTKEDIHLSHLYDRLNVPVDWINKSVLRQKINEGLNHVFQRYGQPMSEKHEQLAFNSIVNENDKVDFGRLDEPLQEQILLKIYHDPSLKSELSEYVGKADSITGETVNHNKHIIEENYNLKQYGDRLLSVYDHLLSQYPDKIEYLNAKKLLDQFLNPERFNLLRT